LFLVQTRVTDAEVEHLKRLPQLEELGLTGTQITDAGLGYLKGLTNLKVLFLSPSKVTASDVAKLQKALPNCAIDR